MASYRTNRIISVSLIVIIIGAAIFGLVYFARILFFSGVGSILSQTNTSISALLSTDADRAVRMTVRGPIVADENSRSYQIKITPNERILTIYRGYENQEINNISLDNNIPAYEQFVYALNNAKMMNANELSDERNDTRGVCATGRLYEFQILKADKSVKKLWATSCSRTRGSLGVSYYSLNNLFTVQIPDARDKIGDLWR